MIVVINWIIITTNITITAYAMIMLMMLLLLWLAGTRAGLYSWPNSLQVHFNCRMAYSANIVTTAKGTCVCTTATTAIYYSWTTLRCTYARRSGGTRSRIFGGAAKGKRKEQWRSRLVCACVSRIYLFSRPNQRCDNASARIEWWINYFIFIVTE